MAGTQAAPDRADRKQLGAWYTPPELVDIVVDRVVDDVCSGDVPTDRRLRVLDPACGDGRFLIRTADRLRDRGVDVDAVGVDVDRAALARLPRWISAVHGDALDHDWGDRRFDVVVGNPPFLSQMASVTTRGGSSRHGGGPYADAAAEFLALAVRLADPDGGRVGLVLPQSILGARDAGPIRAEVDRIADRSWAWWEPDRRWFDANVHVCALGFRRPARRQPTAPTWTDVVTSALGVPTLPFEHLATDGTIGDRADLNANFRDEYYALVDAVDDDADGPPLVTSRLIDPGRCSWGERTVRFAKRDFEHPRVDLDRLHGRFRRWADRKLVPKVLVANQTRVIEAVADPDGEWLPGVPVTTVTPRHPRSRRAVTEIAAVLTSPVASVWCWHAAAGTGLSSRAVRVGPGLLADVPWPAGDLATAVAALAAGDVAGCGRAVDQAYGLEADGERFEWWRGSLPD